MKILFATGNKGKGIEVKNLFKNTGFEVFTLADIGDNSDIEETGETFEENAFIKAEYIYKKYNVPVIADDSGLLVEQLDGRPGVYSARYAGENCTYDDNNRKIISELQNSEEPHKAKFLCCALYYDGKNKVLADGELPGKIVKTPVGTNGFGYDPVFVPDGFNNTLAELSLEEKNKISHRALAFRKLKQILTEKPA